MTDFILNIIEKFASEDQIYDWVRYTCTMIIPCLMVIVGILNFIIISKMEAYGKAYRMFLLVMWFVISLTIFVRNDWFECPDLVDKLDFATDMMRPTRWDLLYEQVEQFIGLSIGHLILLFGNIACRKKKENESESSDKVE